MSSIQPSVVPPAQTTVTCRGCDAEMDINWFCKNCSASLCDLCKTRHESDRFLATHKIVPRTGRAIRALDSSKIIETCPDHPDKVVTGFCKDCDVPCCMQCIEERHQRHAITTIENKYMECEDQLNNLVIDLKRNGMTCIDSSIQELRGNLASNERKFENIKSEVNKFREELKETVDKSCDKLVTELDQKQTERTSEVQDVIENSEKDFREKEHFMSLCVEKIRRGGLDLIKFCKLPAPSNVQTLPTILQSTPIFVPARGLIDTITQKVGEIRWEGGEGVDSGTRGARSLENSSATGKTGIKELASVADMRKNDDQGGPPMIPPRANAPTTMVESFDIEIIGSSVVPVGKGASWVAYGCSETMYMYDKKGNKVKSVTVKNGTEIWDIAVKLSGDIIVCSKDKKVRMMSVNGAVTELIDTAPFSPQGVCLMERGEIVVCMSGQATKNHVQVYSPDGKFKLRKMEDTRYKEKQLLVDPYRVVKNDKNISVLNYGSNVVTVGLDCKVGVLYSGSHACERQFFAVGMCVDRMLNYMISDWNNHCVHYVDRSGGLIRLLLTRDQHGIERPWGIGVDDGSRKVWVGSGLLQKSG